MMREQPVKERRKKNEIIRKKIFSLVQFQKARKIGLYVSKEDEVDTWKIIKEVLCIKNIALPSMQKKNLVFFYLRNLGDLKKGVYGIYEPKSSLNAVKLNDLNLIIVPGIAFDLSNNRLGRGLGCYDRLLKKMSSVFKLGLGFDFQIVKNLPVNSKDVPLDKVIIN